LSAISRQLKPEFFLGCHPERGFLPCLPERWA